MDEDLTPQHLFEEPIFSRRNPNNVAAAMIAVLAVLMGLLAAGAWTTYALRQNRIQPISISACKPGSLPGFCLRWFADPHSSWSTDQVLVVVGEVCNSSDKTSDYEVTVAWDNVSSATDFVVVDTSVSWPPGCRAYEFPFEVPAALESIIQAEDTSTTRWKLVGTATPLDDPQRKAFTWDATQAVTLVVPRSEAG